MTKNKPQNLEELIEKIISEHWEVVADPPITIMELEDSLREVARATCDAVRVDEKNPAESYDYNIWNSAIKAQQDKAEEWLGEGGKG